MKQDDTVFKSVYVDPQVDRAVFAHAQRLGTSKDDVYRRFLDVGLAQFASGASLPRARKVVPMLRAVGIHVDVDERLRVLAFNLRLDRSKLVQRLTQLGLRAIEATTGAAAAQGTTPSTSAPASASPTRRRAR